MKYEAYQRANFMFVALCVRYVFMSTVIQVRQCTVAAVVAGEILVVTITHAHTYIVFDYQNNFMGFYFYKTINAMCIVIDTIT